MVPDKPAPESPPQRLRSIAVAADSLPKVYVNGVTLMFYGTDMQIVLTFNGLPQQLVVMPMGVAKDLQQQLAGAIPLVEGKLGVVFPTQKTFEEKMSESSKS